MVKTVGGIGQHEEIGKQNIVLRKFGIPREIFK